MTIRELLESKKYFNIKKKIIKKNIEKELDNKLVDFFIYESNKINEVYINDKSFMSFLDDKIYNLVPKTFSDSFNGELEAIISSGKTHLIRLLCDLLN